MEWILISGCRVCEAAPEEMLRGPVGVPAAGLGERDGQEQSQGSTGGTGPERTHEGRPNPAARDKRSVADRQHRQMTLTLV